ncbi:MAG: hypothetical protein MK066_11700, partial [Crocinitomicaceae bacterium]|nr:hypothetical protein [Crocinitomicaceae bacterium]
MKVNCNFLKVVLFVVGVIGAFHSNANTVVDTVYINKGVMVAVDGTNIPYFAFNSTASFSKENTRLFLDIDDTMELLVINTDNIVHGFDIRHYPNVDTLIPAYDSALVSFHFNTASAHIFYDHTYSFRYMGAGGMIVVDDPFVNSSDFYWNIKEHEVAFNEDIDAGIAVDWS